MIYEYNEKERWIKIDDRIVYLSLTENEIFKKIYKDGNISPEEVNLIIANGYATEKAVNKYMSQLNKKIFGRELNFNDKGIFSIKRWK